jgi:hypothetical protein
VPLRTRRPVSVMIAGWLFIAAGVIGIAYHAGEINPRQPFEFDLVSSVVVRLLAVVGGIFVLRGRSWARWLLIIWLAYHVVLSAFHSRSELMFHAALLAVISWVLFRPIASPFFRSPRAASG